MRRLAVVLCVLASCGGGSNTSSTTGNASGTNPNTPSPTNTTNPTNNPTSAPLPTTPTAFTCNLDSLTGSWRVHFVETNGTCGNIPDAVATAGGSSPIAAACQQNVANVSADKCTADLNGTCPLTNGQGSQTWTQHWVQKSSTELDGVASVDAVAPNGTACRSTYNITATKL